MVPTATGGAAQGRGLALRIRIVLCGVSCARARAHRAHHAHKYMRTQTIGSCAGAHAAWGGFAGDLKAELEHMMMTSSGRVGKNRKLNSFEVKYMRFCVDTHSDDEPKLPALEHFSLVNLMLFGLWCSKNGINGGWDSVSNYVGAAVKMAQRFEVADPRVASEQAKWWWSEYTAKFQKTVMTTRQLKLKIQPAHHQAMAVDFNVGGDADDRRDAAMYSFLMFFTCRIGHLAPHDTKTGAHVIRFCDIQFEPSFEEPKEVFVLLRSTKTRNVNAAKPTWQAVGALEHGNGIDVDTMCPVITLRNYMLAAYAGDPYEPLFQSATQVGRPMPRSQFTTMLRARLLLAGRHLNVPVNVALYSGISWRKGGLSALAGGVAVNHLADHGDHKCIRSTREYTEQTFQERATHSHVIASRYGSKHLAARYTAALATPEEGVLWSAHGGAR